MNNNNNNESVLNVSKLKEVTYTRSKKWAQFMNRLSAVVEESDMLLKNLDENFQEEDEQEDEDSLSNMESDEEEEQEDLDLLQDLKTTFLHNKFNKNETINAQLSKTLNNLNSSNRQEVHAIQSFLDATLPVVEENNRIWKDSGMDNVLSTFDLKKIQQEVGGWLHSNDKPRTFPDCKNLSPILKTNLQQHHTETSSEDSMHSMDTARYIRTSRKYRKIGKISPYNTMNIKTYRLFKSKRDALREKYGYLENDDLLEFDRHCQSKSASRRYIQQPTQSLIYAKNYAMTQERRKKRCRKMHTLQDELSTSAEESLHEEFMHCRKQQHLYGSLKKQYMPYLNEHTMCACAACMTNSARYNAVISTVPRPYRYGYVQERLSVKRESECGCCNDDTLCDNAIHLADTSTEKWVVENLYTPTKHKVVNATRLSQHKLKKLVKKSRRTRQQLPFDEIQMSSQNISGIQPLSSTVLSTKSLQYSNGPRPNNSIEKAAEDLEKQQEHIDNFEPISMQSISKLEKLNNNNDEKEAEVENNVCEKTMKKSKKLKKPKATEENAEVKQARLLRSAKQQLKIKKSKRIEEQKKLEQQKTNYVQPISKTKSAAKSSSKSKKNATKKQHKTKENKNPKPKLESKSKDLSTIYEQIDLTNESFKNNEKAELTKHISADCDTTIGNDVVIIDAFAATKELKTTTTQQENDCTAVTSTTNNTQQKILIYNPEDRDTIPQECLKDGGFILTQEYLSKILGDKPASKFLKYYLGQRKFDINSIIYFCPPKSPEYDDTESDDDELECFGKHGHLQF